MNTVTINDADGTPVIGTYAVEEGGWVKVTCMLGVKSAALRNLEPAGLASPGGGCYMMAEWSYGQQTSVTSI